MGVGIAKVLSNLRDSRGMIAHAAQVLEDGSKARPFHRRIPNLGCGSTAFPNDKALDTVDWYATAFELIDLRSFSNLWFWITLAYAWSAASHYVIGVPFDVVARAVKYGGQVEEDLKDLVRINASRFTYIADTAGSWLVAFAFFALTGLGIMGFAYGIEFCQALFMIFAPMSLVFALSVRCARRVDPTSLRDIRSKLKRQRLAIQVIGMISILVTSMWGMFHNISTGVLGG